jgi:hypothetical protein
MSVSGLLSNSRLRRWRAFVVAGVGAAVLSLAVAGCVSAAPRARDTSVGGPAGAANVLATSEGVAWSFDNQAGPGSCCAVPTAGGTGGSPCPRRCRVPVAVWWPAISLARSTCGRSGRVRVVSPACTGRATAGSAGSGPACRCAGRSPTSVCSQLSAERPVLYAVFASSAEVFREDRRSGRERSGRSRRRGRPAACGPGRPASSGCAIHAICRSAG